MEITVAKSAGFCFGVQKAVDSVYKELEENSGKIYTFGPIIHNEQVVEDLNKKGIEVIDTVEQLRKLKKEQLLYVPTALQKKYMIFWNNRN